MSLTVKQKYKEILDEIFSTVRQLIRTNSKLYNSLSEEYKNGIMFYMNMIPEQYSGYIINSYKISKEYLSCVDIHKFFEITSKYNMTGLEIKTEQLVGNFIIESFNDLKIRRFVSEIVRKLNRIFICLDYAFAHPKEILKNAAVFDVIEDVF